MVLYHDALRLHLAPEDAACAVVHVRSVRGFALFTGGSIAQLTDEEEWDAVFGTLRALQMSLNMHTGPLFKVVLFERGAAQPAICCCWAIIWWRISNRGRCC